MEQLYSAGPDTKPGAGPDTASGVNLESPLVGATALLDAHRHQGAAASGAFRARERAFCDLVNLRGNAGDPAFAEAVERVTGCRPPQQPNTRVRGSRFDMLWLGPDEWLVRSYAAQNAAQNAAQDTAQNTAQNVTQNAARVTQLEVMLATALAGQFASAVDVSSGYATLELTGAKVRDVLARGCPLDLHPRAFAPGQCAQSHFFKASIVLVSTADDAFDIIVRRSFADYFVQILLDAAAPVVA